MQAWFRSGSYSLSPVAETGTRFADFTPYVASIDDAGNVAFQATLQEGGSGVYMADGQTITTMAASGNEFRNVCSHPDINGGGAFTFYADLDSGARAVLSGQGNAMTGLSNSAGPLGPTINEAGTVAFREGENGPHSGIFRSSGQSVTTIAESGARFRKFHGLPVIGDNGAVTFRADLTTGGEGIYVGDAERTDTIVETGTTFTGLGLFPFRSNAGVVAFCASLRVGGSGVFAVLEGEIAPVVDTDSGFESFRGVLLDASGRVVFYATPRSGTLGVFSGPDPIRDCVLAVGSSLLGSTVAEFALNPVSINDAGQLAIRVALADGRQAILRADPEDVMGTD